MLDSVGKLRKHIIRNIRRALRNEIHADALRSNQPNHLCNLLHQRLRRIVKQQMRFIKEEHQPRLFRIAHFGKTFEKLGQQPQKEGGIGRGVANQPHRVQDIDVSSTVDIGTHPIANIQRGFAEQHLSVLFFECKQSALDRADGRSRNIAVQCGIFGAIVRNIGKHRAQILQIQKQ